MGAETGLFIAIGIGMTAVIAVGVFALLKDRHD